MIEVTWATMKDFIDTRGVSPQVVIEGGAHLIHAADNYFQLSTKLVSSKHAADIQDFTDNYLSSANAKPRETFIRRLGEDIISASPRTLQFNDAGEFDKELISSTGLISILGCVTYIDKAGWALGDKMGITIIDKNDVLGLGGTAEDPTLVSTPIPDGEWGLMPDIANELLNEAISSPTPNGLFLRLKVVKGAANTPKGILNIYAYEV